MKIHGTTKFKTKSKTSMPNCVWVKYVYWIEFYRSTMKYLNFIESLNALNNMKTLIIKLISKTTSAKLIRIRWFSFEKFRFRETSEQRISNDIICNSACAHTAKNKHIPRHLTFLLFIVCSNAINWIQLGLGL